MTEVIKSISHSDQEIIRNILKLHCKGPIELDPTYSKGNFYKDGVEKPKYKFDLFPQTKDTIKANAEELPVRSDSINTIMFDPPFLATKGKSLDEVNDSNIIGKRFGVYPTEHALFSFYSKALSEFHRILKDDGILIFKCQDKVSSGRQYFSHVFIINEAVRVGFYCKDLFVLLAKNRLVPKWQLRNQKNARKFHCYYLVLQKTKRKVIYKGEQQ